MVYFFIAEGFEEIEALCPLDLLRRAGIDAKTVGVGSREITGSHGITVKCDMRDDELCDSSADMIFLPGGMPGTLNLRSCETVIKAVLDANERKAYIAAICAAPMILGELGLLKGKEAICYPGFEDKLIGAKISDSRVVADGNILTAAGMGAALDFGLLIVKIFKGETAAEELRRAIIAD